MPTPAEIEEILPVIERYVILLYDKASSEMRINNARKFLFAHKGRDIENIPPTQDALKQHLLRVGYQAGHIWGQALMKAPSVPSPEDFGWSRKNDTEEWQVKWTTLPPAGMACRAILKCSCTKGCNGKCQCKKASLSCTMLCKCGGCKNQ